MKYFFKYKEQHLLIWKFSHNIILKKNVSKTAFVVQFEYIVNKYMQIDFYINIHIHVYISGCI